MPSPAAPSPCPPSSNMGVELKTVAGSTRQKRLITKPEGNSSTIRAVIATAWVDFGTNGECDRFRINGATLLVITEFTRPGVPPAGPLGAQFCPSLLPRFGLRSSIDFPSPSAGEYQVQPRCPRSSDPRWRWDQS